MYCSLQKDDPDPKALACYGVVEHDGLLTAQQLAERVCAYFGCPYEYHLSIPEKVA